MQKANFPEYNTLSNVPIYTGELFYQPLYGTSSSKLEKLKENNARLQVERLAQLGSRLIENWIFLCSNHIDMLDCTWRSNLVRKLPVTFRAS